MGLLTDCETHFRCKSLYDVLGISKAASENELKKAYRKASLLVHPDRVEEKEKLIATQRFQVLAKVYFILSDKEKRTVYDETGEVDDENDVPNDRDWNEYWRLLFPKITVSDVDKFLQKYKGSEEEKQDLLSLYEKNKGDFDLISEQMMGYTYEEEDRYRKIIEDCIKRKEIKAYKKFTKESNEKRSSRKDKLKDEEKEAEELRKSLQLDETAESLKGAIMKKRQTRESDFDSMIASLEAKYGNKKQKGSTKSKRK